MLILILIIIKINIGLYIYYLFSPVHIAASIGSVEGLQLLKVYGGDFDIQSAQYTSPLHDAAANGNTGMFVLEK